MSLEALPDVPGDVSRRATEPAAGLLALLSRQARHS